MTKEHEHVSRTRTTDTGTRMNAKCQSSNAKREREPEAGGLRVEAEGKMSKFKIQMTNGDELVGCISLIGFIG